eukprot:361771-Chlamydomonas_euryale.AAC.4
MACADHAPRRPVMHLRATQCYGMAAIASAASRPAGACTYICMHAHVVCMHAQEVRSDHRGGAWQRPDSRQRLTPTDSEKPRGDLVALHKYSLGPYTSTAFGRGTDGGGGAKALQREIKPAGYEQASSHTANMHAH